MAGRVGNRLLSAGAIKSGQNISSPWLTKMDFFLSFLWAQLQLHKSKSEQEELVVARITRQLSDINERAIDRNDSA